MKKFGFSLLLAIIFFITTAHSSFAANVCIACGLYGDADHNYQLTSNDSRLVLNAVAGFTNPSSRDRLIMDVDYDGGITSADALYIDKFVAGTITTFPACVTKSSPCGSKGDVNNDGKISKEDSDTVLLITLESLPVRNISNADVNADGKVDSTDALLITRYLKGLDTTFAACSNTRR